MSCIQITSDFGMKHGEEKAHALISNWEHSLSSNVDVISDLINNPIIARDLRRVKSSKSKIN